MEQRYHLCCIYNVQKNQLRQEAPNLVKNGRNFKIDYKENANGSDVQIGVKTHFLLKPSQCEPLVWRDVFAN